MKKTGVIICFIAIAIVLITFILKGDKNLTKYEDKGEEEDYIYYKVMHVEYDEKGKLSVAPENKCTHIEKKDDTEETTDESDNKAEDNPHIAYAEYAKWIKNECPSEYNDFALINTGGSVIPRLIAMKNNPEKELMNYGGQVPYNDYHFIICTYHDSKIHVIEEFELLEDLYGSSCYILPKENLITKRSYYRTLSEDFYSVYRIGDESMDMVESGSYDMDSDSYEINNSMVPQSEYEGALDKWFGDKTDAKYLGELDYISTKEMLDKLR